MAVDIYDATLDDVDQLLVWDVRESTDPPASMVETWISLGAAELHGRVGDILADTPCGGEAFRLRARLIVALFAAAMAEDAHYPERAVDREAGSYGAVLWARYTKTVAELATDIEACRDGIDPGAAHGGSGHTFPSPPFFAREQGT
jgi:hypothetical protein